MPSFTIIIQCICFGNQRLCHLVYIWCVMWRGCVCVCMVEPRQRVIDTCVCVCAPPHQMQCCAVCVLPHQLIHKPLDGCLCLLWRRLFPPQFDYTYIFSIRYKHGTAISCRYHHHRHRRHHHHRDINVVNLFMPVPSAEIHTENRCRHQPRRFFRVFDHGCAQRIITKH